jgi:hypothetical protein
MKLDRGKRDRALSLSDWSAEPGDRLIQKVIDSWRFTDHEICAHNHMFPVARVAGRRIGGIACSKTVAWVFPF